MFGLNPSELLFISTIITVIGTTIVGLVQGRREREDADERVVPLSIAGGIIATQSQAGLTEAINGLADTIQKASDVWDRRQSEHVAESLEQLSERFRNAIERREDRKP